MMLFYLIKLETAASNEMRVQRLCTYHKHGRNGDEVVTAYFKVLTRRSHEWIDKEQE
jgi:hypothetical protein